MKLTTLLSILRSGQLRLQLKLLRLLNPMYRACFVSAAASHGLLRKLTRGPISFEALAADFAPDSEMHGALKAWLRFGVVLGELSVGVDGYELRGRLARQMADPRNDPYAALLEEAVTLDHELLMRTPTLLAQRRKFSFAEQQQYGKLIARSSRTLEPFVFDALAEVIPANGELRMLEVGCGAGSYIRYCAARNGRLTAVGLELQPEVAALAQENIRAWRLEERVSIEVGDVRNISAQARFDLVTLHNNIYYFPMESRTALLAHLGTFLRPNGRLLITSACEDRNPATEILNLWAEMTEGCGRLPTAQEMVSQIKEAGFVAVRPRRLIPGYAYYSFVGSNTH